MRKLVPLLLCVSVSASCFRKEYVYLPAVDSCLKEPPPVERAVKPTFDGCPEQFVYCLDKDAGLDLEHNVKVLRDWNKEAWTRCSIHPDGGTQVDGGR